MRQRHLQQARANKNDEFYTQLHDIEQELKRYKSHFKGKTVFCNCDDPEWSNFWLYFAMNFDHLKLKKLIATHYEEEKPAYKLELSEDRNKDGRIDKKDVVQTQLKENGDFRSDECVEILKQADIVVTNPPFSLFREYVAQLIEHDKSFLIIGNINALTYKETFQLIKEDKLWLGYKKMGTDMLFDVSKDFAEKLVATKKEGSGYRIVDGVVKARASAVWFTNLNTGKRNETLILTKKYIGNKSNYPKYDNYDAINVDLVKDIPGDYDGAIGVPVSFVDKYNPDQFEILGNEYDLNIDKGRGYINGKRKYGRMFIKNKTPIKG